MDNQTLSNLKLSKAKIRWAKRTGEVMVEILPIDTEKIELLKKIPEIKSIYLTEKNHRKLVFGLTIIHEKIGRFTFQISPDTPFDFSTVDEKKLEALKKRVDVKIGDRVLILNCGVGILPIYLSTLAGKVVGIDADPIAIRDAHDNAKLNHCQNLEFTSDFSLIDDKYKDWILLVVGKLKKNLSAKIKTIKFKRTVFLELD